MQLFKKDETVTFNGHKMTVENVYDNGTKADLVCEIIPFMPMHCMGIKNTEVFR